MAIQRRLSLPLLCTAMLATAPALAQQPTGARAEFEAPRGPVTVVSVQPPLPNADDYRVRVADLDGNGNDAIDRREVPEGHALASEWTLVDRNRDNRITQAELDAWK